jgi:hypothetical protein
LDQGDFSNKTSEARRAFLCVGLRLSALQRSPLHTRSSQGNRLFLLLQRNLLWIYSSKVRSSLFGGLSQGLRGITLFLGFTSLSDRLFVFWNRVSEESPHGFVSYKCVEVNVLKLFGFYPRCKPIAYPFNIFSVSYVDGRRFALVRSQQLLDSRHPTVFRQNGVLRAFPLLRHSKEFLFPELVVCQPALEFDEDRGCWTASSIIPSKVCLGQ